MIDQYEVNTQIVILALFTVIPAVMSGVFVSLVKKTRKDRQFIAAGLAGIAVSTLLFFAAAVSLTPEHCCEESMIEHDAAAMGFFSLLRFLSTPLALVSVCFFFRGLSRDFNRRYIAEISVLLILIWLMLFF